MDVHALPNALARKLVIADSSFYQPILLAPLDQREAMFELYRYCRCVDDIADGDAPRIEKLAELTARREQIHACYQGTPPPSLLKLAIHMDTYALARADFDALIDGMMMDAIADIVMPDWATLRRYCEHVSCAAGRLLLRIVGIADEAAAVIAHHAGHALQLVNILRDVAEDAGRGRLYIPREALTRAGVQPDRIDLVLRNPGFHMACLEVRDAAVQHFEQARARLAAEAPNGTAVPLAMLSTYHDLLMRTSSTGWRFQ